MFALHAGDRDPERAAPPGGPEARGRRRAAADQPRPPRRDHPEHLRGQPVARGCRRADRGRQGRRRKRASIGRSIGCTRRSATSGRSSSGSARRRGADSRGALESMAHELLAGSGIELALDLSGAAALDGRITPGGRPRADPDRPRGLSNVARHSGARQAPDRTRASRATRRAPAVEDDGAGFDPARAPGQRPLRAREPARPSRRRRRRR